MGVALEKKNRKAGRPSVVWSNLESPESINELARRVCLLGATNADLAMFFGVSVKTIEGWMDTKPDFAKAVREGKQFADAKVAESLYHRSIGYSHPSEKIMTVSNGKGEGSHVERIDTIEHYPPDPTSMIFWLKNRRPDLWRDKVDLNGANVHVGDVINNDNRKQTVNIVEVPKEQARAAYERMLAVK